jgi:isopenicillin-N epimerase
MPTKPVSSPPGAAEDATGLRTLFLLRPDVIFLNHGSFGACARPVFEEYQRWQLELERQPVEFLARRHDGLLAGARNVLGAYVGADPDDLVYVPNATTGLNTVARSIDLGPGDEVLASDHEYGALDRTWRFLCAKRGASYVRRPVPVPLESAEQFIETIWSGVTPRTRVLHISHITSPTAIIFPVKELIRRARAEGILSVIDGAHAPGQIALNLEELEPDVYSGNLHKWLCTPKGSSFLYVRRERQRLIEPLVVSWGYEAEKPGPSRFIDEQQFNGTRDIAAYLAVPAAIRFLAEHDWDAVRARCHALVRDARARISALTGLSPPVPDDPAWFAQMAALPLPPCDVDALKARLVDEYHIEVPVYIWNERPWLRISVQGYNSQADIDALVAALATLLPTLSQA